MYLLFSIKHKLVYKKAYVPFIPTNKKDLKYLSTKLTLRRSDSIIDVGSGWGTVIFKFAKLFPEIKLIGVEINPVLYLISKLREKIFYFKEKHRIKFYLSDALLFDYSNYSVVFIFGISEFLDKKLIPKLEKELIVGSRVISYEFPIESKHFSVKEIKIDSDIYWIDRFYIATKIR